MFCEFLLPVYQNPDKAVELGAHLSDLVLTDDRYLNALIPSARRFMPVIRYLSGAVILREAVKRRISPTVIIRLATAIS